MSNVDFYLFPCRGKSAKSQVDEIIDHVGSGKYGMIWIDIEYNPSSTCTWATHSHESNCEFIKEMV